MTSQGELVIIDLLQAQNRFLVVIRDLLKELVRQGEKAEISRNDS